MRIRLPLLVCMSFVAALSSGQGLTSVAPEEMKSTDYMVGTWEGTITMTGMGQDKPSKSTIVCDKILSGRFVRQMHSYTVEGMGELSGMLLLTYDADAKGWVSWWYDSTTSEAMQSTGTSNGTDTVLTSKPTKMEGSDVIVRTTWTKVSDKHAKLKVELQQGSDWTTLLVGDYTKKG